MIQAVPWAPPAGRQPAAAGSQPGEGLYNHRCVPAYLTRFPATLTHRAYST